MPREDGEGIKSVEAAMLAVGEQLREACVELRRQAVGESGRAKDLEHTLGLDKSLASRLKKMAEADSPFAVLEQAPAPQGWSLILRGAVRSGVSDSCLRLIESAGRALEDLIRRFPGGRGDLHIALGGFLGDWLEASTLTSQREVHKAMRQMHGCSVESHEVQTWYAPNGDDPSMVDYAWSSSMLGLRRLRDRATLVLGGTYDAEDPTVMERRVTLDGDLLPGGFQAWIVEDLSTLPDGATELRSVRPSQLLVLPPGRVELAHPYDLVIAARTPSGLSRHATEGDGYAQGMVMSRLPATALRVDYFVHRSLGFGEPQCQPTLSILPLGVYAQAPGEHRTDRSEVVFTLTKSSEGGAAAVEALSRTGRTIAKRFTASAGWDAQEFDAWTLRVTHPVPMVTMHTWFPKPAPEQQPE
ncbi:MAG: hypothetical protein AAGB48_06060 [Planctomycetota bacterium]